MILTILCRFLHPTWSVPQRGPRRDSACGCSRTSRSSLDAQPQVNVGGAAIHRCRFQVSSLRGRLSKFVMSIPHVILSGNPASQGLWQITASGSAESASSHLPAPARLRTVTNYNSLRGRTTAGSFMIQYRGASNRLIYHVLRFAIS